MTTILAHLALATLGVSVLLAIALALRTLTPRDPVLRVRLLDWFLFAALMVLPLQMLATAWLPDNLRASSPISIEELRRASARVTPVATPIVRDVPTFGVVNGPTLEMPAESPAGMAPALPNLPAVAATPAPAPVNPAAALPLVFLSGCVVIVARTVVGFFRVRRIIRRSVLVANPHLIAALDDACRSLGVATAVNLRSSPDLHVPASWAIGRACILLPSDAVTLEHDQLHHVLLHELLHIRRRDSWLALLRSALCALNWFNPLVWVFSRTCDRETELACDALVVRATRRPQTYARCLLDFCHDRPSRCREASTALLASFGAAPLERRLLMLSCSMDRPRNRGWLACGVSLIAIAAALVAQAALAAGGAADDAEKQEQRAKDKDAEPPIDVRFETDAVTRLRVARIASLDIPRRSLGHVLFDRQLRTLGYVQGADGRRSEGLRPGESVTEQETVASFTNARKSGTTFIVRDALLSLPEGSNLTAEFEGPKISLSADGRTTTLNLGGGVLRVRDQENVARITIRSQAAGDAAVALQAALTIENDEVVLRLSPTAKDEGASIRIEFDLQTGIPADEKDPPSGSIRYKLLEPGDREGDPYRLKMQWRYELADEAKPADPKKRSPAGAR